MNNPLWSMVQETTKTVYTLLLVGLFFGCQRDSRDRIFEMVYPNIRFEIPAGLSPGLPRVFEIDNFATDFAFYRNEFQTDTSAIAGISPFSARFQSFLGEEFDFLQEVSVRICTAGTSACTPADEVFFIDNLQNENVGNQVRLLPNDLRNVEQLMSQERVKLEIVFFLLRPSPQSIDTQFEMVFEAYR